MDARLADLVLLLDLEQIEDNIFRGASRDIGSPQVYGGQVLGQALQAAYRTVPADRQVHSLHAYFLRRGDFNAPIVYFVDLARDGHSFTSRRVTAIQHGEQIFNLSASFQMQEAGVEHQAAMPQVPPPEELKDSRQALIESQHELPERMRRYLARSRPFEFRMVEPLHELNARPGPPAIHVWMRAVDRVGDDLRLHQALLAYVSDYHLLSASLRPHGLNFSSQQLVVASIDHAMWFHRPLQVDEWFLYAVRSPSASGARGFSQGSIYRRDGVLAASTAQEGLIRVAPAT